MKKIKWLATGGTISCIQTEIGLHPAAAESQMCDMLNHIPETGAEIVPECIMNIDSSDISVNDMKLIGIAADNAIKEGYDGIVITHGTDTMAYTSAVLRKMLSGTPIPVIITGSQRPFYSADSDGKANLLNAIKAAADSSLRDVFLLFGDKLIRGDRAHKDYTENDNAFVSSCGYSGIIQNGRLIVNEFPNADTEYHFNLDFNENVMLIKLTPLTDGSIFTFAAESGVKGIVIDLLGVGMSGFREDEYDQDTLYDVAREAPTPLEAEPVIVDDVKRRGLLDATDALRDRFGEGAVRFGHELRNAGNTTGTGAKNPDDYK